MKRSFVVDSVVKLHSIGNVLHRAIFAKKLGLPSSMILREVSVLSTLFRRNCDKIKDLICISDQIVIKNKLPGDGFLF